MANEIIESNVVKGGVCWLEMSVGRNKQGLSLWYRSVPAIEEFFINVSDGGLKENTAVYNREWWPLEPQKELEVYRLEKPLQNNRFSFGHIGEPFTIQDRRTGAQTVNLSLLQVVGISNPAGVNMGIKGLYSKGFARDLSTKLMAEVREFVREYIVPININLRISSQEV